MVYAIDRPVSAAAGIVVTKMKTPMRAADRASVSDTTPTIPARMATISENRFGLSIRFETGRTPSEYAGGCGRTSGSPGRRSASR